MPLTLTQRLASNPNTIATHTLSLTADERLRSRHYFRANEGQDFYLSLPRGTVLQQGDLLRSSESEDWVRVVAKPEPVITVTATHALPLLRAAYHLGNRHVLLEVTESYLRLSPDPVLKGMLEQLGLQVVEETVPFQPEAGAYGSYESHHDSH